MSTTFICLSIIAALGAATPLAEHHELQDVVAHVFESSDMDADGTLTRDEYSAAGLHEFGVTFDECDRDADDRISVQEYRAIYDLHHPGERREASLGRLVFEPTVAALDRPVSEPTVAALGRPVFEPTVASLSTGRS
jgi:hypothetical protein